MTAHFGHISFALIFSIGSYLYWINVLLIYFFSDFGLNFVLYSKLFWSASINFFTTIATCWLSYWLQQWCINKSCCYLDHIKFISSGCYLLEGRLHIKEQLANKIIYIIHIPTCQNSLLGLVYGVIEKIHQLLLNCWEHYDKMSLEEVQKKHKTRDSIFIFVWANALSKQATDGLPRQVSNNFLRQSPDT